MNKQTSEDAQNIKQRKYKRRTKRMIKQGIIGSILGITLFIAGIFLFSNGNTDKKEKETETQEVFQPIEITEEPEEPKIVTASILSAGDVILHSPFLSSRIYCRLTFYTFLPDISR